MSIVRAAGAVLYRRGADGAEIALVHRDRYDDWSHSKGHVDAGEHPVTAARREVLEETGFAVRLGRRLPSLHYTAKGRPKQVEYWSAEVAPGAAFVPNDEVDELRWLTPADARCLLSYPHDAAPLDALLTDPLPDTTVLLLRHGKAGDRHHWAGADELRPLDADGQVQASQLAVALASFGVTSVHAAVPLRCQETVAPLAATLGAPLVLTPALGDDAYRDDPFALLDVIRSVATTGGSTVLCSQGSTIPATLTTLLTASDLPVPGKVHCRKGSWWTLSFAGGRLVAADYERDAAPVA